MALLTYGDNVIISRKGNIFVYNQRNGERLSPAEEVATVTRMMDTLLRNEGIDVLEKMVRMLGVENLKNLFMKSLKGVMDGFYLEKKVEKALVEPLDINPDPVEDMLRKVINAYTDYKGEVTFSPNLLNVLWKMPKPYNLSKIVLFCYGAVICDCNHRGLIEDEFPYWEFVFDFDTPKDIAFAFEDLKISMEEDIKYYSKYVGLRYIVEEGLYKEMDRDFMLNLLMSETDVTPKVVEKPKLVDFFSSLKEADFKDDFFIEKHGKEIVKYLALDFSPSPANEPAPDDQIGLEV